MIGDGSSIGEAPLADADAVAVVNHGARTTNASVGARNDGTIAVPSETVPGGHTGAQAEASHAAPEFLDHHTSSSCRTRTRRNPSLPDEEAADDETTFSTVCPIVCPTVATL